MTFHSNHTPYPINYTPVLLEAVSWQLAAPILSSSTHLLILLTAIGYRLPLSSYPFIFSFSFSLFPIYSLLIPRYCFFYSFTHLLIIYFITSILAFLILFSSPSIIVILKFPILISSSSAGTLPNILMIYPESVS